RAVLVTTYPIGLVTPASYPDGIYGSRTRVAVIDTATGSQVGTQLHSGRAWTRYQEGGADLTAGGGNAHLIANDRRVLITTDAYSQTTDTNTTRVAVLNTETGN
ncbi:hypothetical protein C6A85_71350, partial [Mycobacterium sp. ITM-2017-0098]